MVMTGYSTGGILRAALRIANTVDFRRWHSPLQVIVLAVLISIPTDAYGQQSQGLQNQVELARQLWLKAPIRKIDDGNTIRWDLGRSDDPNFDHWPDDWMRVPGVRYPKYVKVLIKPHDPIIEQKIVRFDTGIIKRWQQLRESYPLLTTWMRPLPPRVADAMVGRFLRIELNGGQVKVLTTRVEASRLYQYRFSCQIKTTGLRHDTAYAELVFLDEKGDELFSQATNRIGGTTDWMKVQIERLRPPVGATTMCVRLNVEGAEDGVEDIDGVIGFDNLRIQKYPQLRVVTNEPLGIYDFGQPIEVTANVLGLSMDASKVRFRLYSGDDEPIGSPVIVSMRQSRSSTGDSAITRQSDRSALTWRLPRLPHGFYRVTAELEGGQSTTLATETTLAVIEKLVDGPPHGCFGWTLPEGNQEIEARDLAAWLAKLGVAWVKYPCWLAPDDSAKAQEVATIFGKLQDAGIQTIGMLDVPPVDQIARYTLRGRRDMVAAQMFRDESVWRPQLEPVMTRLTLKVRTWQLGADRDHSFLGRPRLQESIKQISTGLQGFGQPIDVAISWPWLEPPLEPGEASWQAVCRSSDPPLGASELDAFLKLGETDSLGDGPRTWLLLDPVSSSQYDRDDRIRDLVLRMATVRNHRVQASFISDPRDPEYGLLRPDGRPGEMLLPWRTTSRLIGNLRQLGSLKLRCGAMNTVFASAERAVLLVWSAEPTEELIYLGENVRSVDVWGRAEELPIEQQDGHSVQRVKIGPIPRFIVGADPMLLAFRMSVNLDKDQLDSLLGQVQKLAVSFTNPTRDGLIGELQILPPEAWTIESAKRPWETLGGQSSSHSFNVVLGSSAKVGTYEVPIRFEIQTFPPKQLTVYRRVNVGPQGLDLNVNTQLSPRGELKVQIEMTNRSSRKQSYDCMLFPPQGSQSQYQRRFITIQPGEMIRKEIIWQQGESLVGGKMLLRAVEQDGRRVVNHAFDVTH